MSKNFHYIRDPEKIYQLSFQRIREAVDLSPFPPSLQPLIIRMIHSCGIPSIATSIHWHGDVTAHAFLALDQKRPILVDALMVKAAVTSFQPLSSPLICTLNHPQTPTIAQKNKTTRSAAAVDLWKEHLDHAIVVIGNAPTALFRLLECLSEHSTPSPALIIGMPVGFVGAAEAKDALIEHAPCPFITLKGKIGGSAIAASALNALILSHSKQSS
jgi:precorrin-8X/cobalt-precorrin-8 methylmutase